MPKVPLRSVGLVGKEPEREPPPHKNVRVRVRVVLDYDQEVDVDSFFHPGDYKGSEDWDEFITSSIADSASGYDESADIQSVRRWMDDWNMLAEAEEYIDIDWEWVQ